MVQTLISHREGEKNTKTKKKERKKKRHEKDKPRSFAYPAAFLILLASLFISRYVKPDNAGCTNEDPRVPSYRAIASACVNLENSEIHRYRGTYVRTKYARMIRRNVKRKRE